NSRRSLVRRTLLVSLVSVCLATFVSGQSSGSAPERFDAARAHVYKAAPGQSLQAAPKAAPAAAASVALFLGSKGVSPSTVASLQAAAEKRDSRSGMTHVRLEQRVSGLRVADAYAKATLNARGEIVHVIENLATVPAAGLVPARIDEAQAMQAALAH